MGVVAILEALVCTCECVSRSLCVSVCLCVHTCMLMCVCVVTSGCLCLSSPVTWRHKENTVLVPLRRA